MTMDLDFSINMPITKEDILRHVSEEDIFCHYIGIPAIPKSLIRSVLREDRHPTCSFFRGKTGINCFVLIAG